MKRVFDKWQVPFSEGFHMKNGLFRFLAWSQQCTMDFPWAFVIISEFFMLFVWRAYQDWSIWKKERKYFQNPNIFLCLNIQWYLSDYSNFFFWLFEHEISGCKFINQTHHVPVNAELNMLSSCLSLYVASRSEIKRLNNFSKKE